MASVSDVIDAAGFANDATRIGFLTTFFRQQNASWKRQQASDKQYAVASAAHRKEEEQIWTTWRAARDQCEFDYGHCTAGWTACQDQRIECVTAADEARDAALRALEAQKRAATEPWGDSLSNESQKRRELFEAMLVAWDASGARYATLVEGAGRGLHPPDPAFVGVSRARCLGAPQEMIPDRVYVGPPFDRQKAPEGFVDAAVKFHQKDWGLTVTKPNSLSKLIEDLAKQSGVHRVRLVAHGMPHVAGEDSALNLAIFPKAETWLGREALEALAASDIAIVEYMAQLTSFVKRRVPPAARRIAKEIPDRFGRLNLANRSSDLEAFMVYVAILAQKDVFDKVDVSARKDLKSAVQLLSELYHAKLVESGIAKKDLDALAESIRSATASASMLTQLSVTKREEGEQPLRQCLVPSKLVSERTLKPPGVLSVAQRISISEAASLERILHISSRPGPGCSGFPKGT